METDLRYCKKACDAKGECAGFFLDKTDPDMPICGNYYRQTGLNKLKVGSIVVNGDCYQKRNGMFFYFFAKSFFFQFWVLVILPPKGVCRSVCWWV